VSKQKIPHGISSSIKKVFSSTSSLNSADWFQVLGPFALWVLEEAPIAPGLRQTLQRWVRWMWRIRAKSILKAELPALELEGFIVATELECALPLSFSTINAHLLHHHVHRIRTIGPTYCQTM